MGMNMQEFGMFGRVNEYIILPLLEEALLNGHLK